MEAADLDGAHNWDVEGSDLKGAHYDNWDLTLKARREKQRSPRRRGACGYVCVCVCVCEVADLEGAEGVVLLEELVLEGPCEHLPRLRDE